MLNVQILGNNATGRKSSNSTSIRKLVRAVKSKDRVSEHELHKPSIHDEDLPFSCRRSWELQQGTQHLHLKHKDQCVDMKNVHVFVNESSHSSWTKFLANLEVYKNTIFENIWSLFKITKKLMLEHSEEILNVHTIDSAPPDGRDRHCLMINCRSL